MEDFYLILCAIILQLLTLMSNVWQSINDGHFKSKCSIGHSDELD